MSSGRTASPLAGVLRAIALVVGLLMLAGIVYAGWLGLLDLPRIGV